MSKAVWGHITWLFFHTLAEKVRDEHYEEARPTIRKTLLDMCASLPCPECSQHATQYLSRVDFGRIRTRKDLKLMLFAFHNKVNRDLGKPQAGISQLDRYYHADIDQIVSFFMRTYDQQQFSYGRIFQSTRVNVLQPRRAFYAWFRANRHMFR